MRKSDLVKVARKELGMSLAQAKPKTRSTPSTVDEDYEMIPDRCVWKERKFQWMTKEQMVFHLGAIKTKAYIDSANSGELEWRPNPFTGLDTEWMREYLVEIATCGERESAAINHNLENKKEEDMIDD